MIESEQTAFEVACLPAEYGEVRLNQLFTRGYNRWETNGESDRGQLIEHIESFGDIALKSETVTPDFVEGPGDLAVVATLAAISATSFERFDTDDPNTLEPYMQIKRLYFRTLQEVVREYNDLSIQQNIAEVLYRKDFGPNGGYAGRTCTGIVHRPGIDAPGEWFVEIPVVAGSQKCIVEELETTEASSSTEQAGLTTQSGSSLAEEDPSIQTGWEGNRFYIPVADLDRRFEEYIVEGRGFDALYAAHRNGLSREQREWVQDHVERIQGTIGERFERNHYEQIWADWEPGQQLVDVVSNALAAAPDAKPGDYLFADEIYEAVDLYSPDSDWEASVVNDIKNPRSLGSQLSAHSDHSAIRVEEQSKRKKYAVGFSRGSGADIEVEEIEDLFELPCMAQMEKRLKEKGPVRKDLYNFVRMAWWLPQYEDTSDAEFIDDIKEVFSRWPWFDPRTTEEQTRYELSNSDQFEEGPPLPMNCNNADVERYCIGRDVCPFTIYGSVPFRDEMYEVLDHVTGDS